jgi:hypothetical protein
LIALTTEQLRQIQLAAHALPVETRAEFLDLVAQQIRPRPIDIESAIVKALRYLMRGCESL